MKVAITCAHCGASAMKECGWVNRSRRAGMNVYCSRLCSGLARRVNRPVEERKRLKSTYDRVRSAVLRDEILQAKREYFRRTYDPHKAREYRKERMPYHVEYCRRYLADPERKRAKVEYDEKRRDELTYGPFAECAKLLRELWKEIKAQEPSWYERKKSQGKYYAINERKRHERAERRSHRAA